MTLEQQHPQQYGSQSTTSQQPIAQQTGGQQTQSTQQRPTASGTLDQALSPEMQRALQQSLAAANACEWCADRCLDEGPQMAECVRLCRDTAELATLHARFIARDSIFGQELAQVFLSVAQECVQECVRHQPAHCQDCARKLEQAIQSTQQMLQSLQSASGDTGPQGPQTQPMGR